MYFGIGCFSTYFATNRRFGQCGAGAVIQSRVLDLVLHVGWVTVVGKM